MQQLSISDIESAIERAIASAAKSKNTARLHDLQQIAGFLMQPADAAHDRDTSHRFRILAARAANAREAVERDEDD